MGWFPQRPHILAYETEIQLRRSRKVGGSYVCPVANRFSSRRVDHNKAGPSVADVSRATTGELLLDFAA